MSPKSILYRKLSPVYITWLIIIEWLEGRRVVWILNKSLRHLMSQSQFISKGHQWTSEDKGCARAKCNATLNGLGKIKIIYYERRKSLFRELAIIKQADVFFYVAWNVTIARKILHTLPFHENSMTEQQICNRSHILVGKKRNNSPH